MNLYPVWFINFPANLLRDLFAPCSPRRQSAIERHSGIMPLKIE
jgi:hypothetical protein